MILRIPLLVAVVSVFIHQGVCKMVKCGKKTIDDVEFICCNKNPTRKSYGDKTSCCDTFAYVPTMETCCNGLINPGFGESNEYGKCCADFSYDKRCYECKKRLIEPLFDYRTHICCDGKVSKLEGRKTCCCGKDTFDPDGLVCCDGKIIKRPDNLPRDCCDCGFTRVDIGILLDSSESIQRENWPKMLNFTKGILQDAEIDNDKVRAGLGIYRHDWTLGFTMDTFHKKTEMFKNISNTGYRPGSTNTGLGIEMMRTIIFSHSNGDRPNVDNLLMVVTDGDSDDPVKTAEEAKKARGEGIHIFAIGINLRNLKELHAIASPPTDQNVFNISNFDELATLKGKIFSSICTGRPVELIYEPCGDDVYDPLEQICCDGNPQPLQGPNTECCEQLSYNVKTDICCEGKINKRKAGNKTVCCVQKAMHPDLELCCEETPVLRPEPEADKCCGIYAYNDRKEICCDDFINPGFGENAAAAACCDGFSYDTRCYDCINGKIVPLFDPSCQICCDGVIHNMTLGFSCCCGKEVFKPEKKICCDGKLRERNKKEKKHICCECGNALVDIGLLADSSESVGTGNWEKLKKFMEDLVEKSDMDLGATRFSLVTFRHNFTEEFYFKTHLRERNAIEQIKGLKYIRGSTNTAEGIRAMNEIMFTEKNGDRPGVPNYLLVITDGESDDPAHTKEEAQKAKDNGIHIIAVGIGLGKTQELKDIASSPWQDNLFTIKKFKQLKKLRSKLYTTFSDICPREPQEKKKQKCGDGLYDPRTEICCKGQAAPLRETLNDTACCEEFSYNVFTQICCKGKVGERVGKKRTECCEETPFDPKDELCCYGTTVLPRAGNKATECCGMSTYDPVTEICCDDVLYPNFGEDGCCGACCVNQSYDTRCYKCEKGELLPLYDCAYQRCCDGVIQNVTSDHTCCCGKKAFDPSVDICCDGKLRKRKKDDDARCCECPSNIVDIIFVLDSSESVHIDNWVKVVKFVEDMITRSNVDQGEVRFGLIMYRHNVTVWFRLNRYRRKADMLLSVKDLPYIRGSTNTGGGLDEARKLFKPQFGDRPRAPNFILLVTDGESDDRDYTIEQATLAKQEGSTIIALGIGIRDMSELEAVASPPVEDNAIPVEDFDELNLLEARLFKDLASSICPQLPKPRCKSPCGEHRIDNNTEICCKEKYPRRRMAGKRTKCCDTVAYDPDCLMCCEDTLVSRFAGEFTDCCCHFAYDRRSHICCGNSIYPKIGGKFTECCHNTSYDTRTHVCCDWTSVQPNYGEGNTACCGDTSYDTRCYECQNNKNVVPIYDTETEMCCDGVIEEKKYAEKSCCCKDEQFDVDISICCDDKLIERPDNKSEVVCCGDDIYDPKKEICCNEKVNDRMNGYETCCCDRKSYHPDKFHCCNGMLNEKRSKFDNCCCQNVVFNVKEEVCCEGTVQHMVEPGNRKSTVCCGEHAFDPKTHICCDRKVHELFEDANTACCGNQAYNVDTHICVDEKLKEMTGVCRGVRYDPDSKICCNGWLNDMPSNNFTRCCFGRAYDIRKHVCCCNGFMQEAFAGIFTQCCYSFGYDSRKAICCDGQVIRKRVPSAECCCDKQSYDSDREICCGGKVRSRCVGLFTKCCGTEAYDPGYKICCGGKLYFRRYGHDTYCCGDQIYTPKMAACCGKRIAYRRKIKMEW